MRGCQNLCDSSHHTAARSRHLATLVNGSRYSQGPPLLDVVLTVAARASTFALQGEYAARQGRAQGGGPDRRGAVVVLVAEFVIAQPPRKGLQRALLAPSEALDSVFFSPRIHHGRDQKKTL